MSESHPALTLYHSPWSRSVGIRWLLEELCVPYRVQFVDVGATKGVDESYRKIQPHKKVPALVHNERVVTERAAIAMYLTEIFPEAGLAPAMGDPWRPAYLTMLVYCDAVFDPCVNARVRGLVHGPSDYSFGAYDDVIANLEARLSQHPYAAGPNFTAADTQLASSLGFTMNVLNAIPRKACFDEYLARVAQRPAYVRAQALDAKLLAAHPEVAQRFAG